MSFLEDMGNLELASATEKASAKKEPKKALLTCEACNGSGLWRQGRVNQHGNNKCNICRGTGKVATPLAERRKRNAQTKARKAAALEAKRLDWISENKELHDFLAAATWSEFAQSLAGSIDRYGSLTEKQQAAAERMMATTIENKKKRDAEKADAPVVDLTGIRMAFEVAGGALKKPTYRAEGLKITMAPASGRNPGALYVARIDGDDYQGKIIDTKFHGVRSASDDTLDALLRISRDPKEAAIKFGRVTGTCCCCGRELTNAESIKAGIGPICAGRWGF